MSWRRPSELSEWEEPRSREETLGHFAHGLSEHRLCKYKAALPNEGLAGSCTCEAYSWFGGHHF